jgi:hypothetical protein
MDVQTIHTVSEEHTASTFSNDDGGSVFLQNFDLYLQVHKASKLRRSTPTKIA